MLPAAEVLFEGWVLVVGRVHIWVPFLLGFGLVMVVVLRDTRVLLVGWGLGDVVLRALSVLAVGRCVVEWMGV